MQEIARHTLSYFEQNCPRTGAIILALGSMFIVGVAVVIAYIALTDKKYSRMEREAQEVE